MGTVLSNYTGPRQPRPHQYTLSSPNHQAPVFRGLEARIKGSRRGFTLVVGSDNKGAVKSDTEAAHGCANLGHELAAACVGRQVPHADVPMLVACAGHHSYHNQTRSECMHASQRERQSREEGLPRCVLRSAKIQVSPGPGALMSTLLKHVTIVKNAQMPSA